MRSRRDHDLVALGQVGGLDLHEGLGERAGGDRDVRRRAVGADLLDAVPAVDERHQRGHRHGQHVLGDGVREAHLHRRAVELLVHVLALGLGTDHVDRHVEGLVGLLGRLDVLDLADPATRGRAVGELELDGLVHRRQPLLRGVDRDRDRPLGGTDLQDDGAGLHRRPVLDRDGCHPDVAVGEDEPAEGQVAVVVEAVVALPPLHRDRGDPGPVTVDRHVQVVGVAEVGERPLELEHVPAAGHVGAEIAPGRHLPVEPEHRVGVEAVERLTVLDDRADRGQPRDGPGQAGRQVQRVAVLELAALGQRLGQVGSLHLRGRGSRRLTGRVRGIVRAGNAARTQRSGGDETRGHDAGPQAARHVRTTARRSNRHPRPVAPGRPRRCTPPCRSGMPGRPVPEGRLRPSRSSG